MPLALLMVPPMVSTLARLHLHLLPLTGFESSGHFFSSPVYIKLYVWDHLANCNWILLWVSEREGVERVVDSNTFLIVCKKFVFMSEAQQMWNTTWFHHPNENFTNTPLPKMCTEWKREQGIRRKAFGTHLYLLKIQLGFGLARHLAWEIFSHKLNVSALCTMEIGKLLLLCQVIHFLVFL